jgi:hypothetical protein
MQDCGFPSKPPVCKCLPQFCGTLPDSGLGALPDPGVTPRLIATVTGSQDLANFLGKIVCEDEKIYLYPAGRCIEKQVIRGSPASKAVPGRKWSLQGRHPSLRHLYKSLVSLLRNGRSLRHFLALPPDSRLLVRVGRHCEFCRSRPDN